MHTLQTYKLFRRESVSQRESEVVPRKKHRSKSPEEFFSRYNGDLPKYACLRGAERIAQMDEAYNKAWNEWWVSLTPEQRKEVK